MSVETRRICDQQCVPEVGAKAEKCTYEAYVCVTRHGSQMQDYCYDCFDTLVENIVEGGILKTVSIEKL